MRKTTRWLGLLLAFAMLAAACGQGEEVTATTSAPAPEETETTDAPAPEETETTEAPEEAMDVAFDGVSVTDDTIYIGMLADLSGPFATLIKDIVDAEEATFDDYNASGGVAGRWKIETIVEDTGYDVTVHGEKYDELKDKVVAFTQSTGSPHTTSIAAKLVEDNLIAIPLSWYSGWADPDLGENVIEQGPNYCIEAMSMVEWMTDRYRSENDGADPTWGIVSFPGEYGQDGAAGAKYATEALGLEVAYDGEGLAAGSANTEVIAGLVAASPDLVFNTLTPTSLGEIFGGAVQSGLTEAQWGGSGPSYNYALLGSPIGPLLSELYTQSGYYAPYGADVKDINSYVKKYINAGETSQQGVEVSAELKPVDYASLSISYTYSRNEYEEYIDGGVDYSGNTMERSPNNRLNARIAVLPLQDLWIELEMDAISSQYSDPANTHEYSRPTLFNLRANYDWQEWSFWGHVLNMTDQKYASYVSYSSSDDTTTLFSGAPLTFIAGISYKWGGDK